MKQEDLRIKNRIYIESSPENVFSILTTAAGWDAWFTTGTELDIIEEGFILLKWKDYGVDRITTQDGGKIISFIENREFAFEWKPGDSITTVTFTLESSGLGTILALEEVGYTTSARDIQAFTECALGWGEAMLMLKVYLEHNIVLK